MSEIAKETALRRTFAIISHPDAGKTTLTEKLLLYSGMVRTAGMVRARKGGKATSSDWMAMEQERGISITASAMQFPYKGCIINLLDTPGHQDFSEDTYRTLTAADSAIMVIDAAKGVENQTRKLFAVCRMRNIPILTFINKMDLPARDPFELLAELEQVLGIATSPMNWPVGSGKSFLGVVNLKSRELSVFERSEQGGAQRALQQTMALDEAGERGVVPAEAMAKIRDDFELLEGAGNPFEKQSFLEGSITPVFFGSALTNFGIEPFFDSFITLAPAPRAYRARRASGDEITVDPVETPFSGFVFKIQSNMNPKHRDSMAYLRVCSGRFDREMTVRHHRLDKTIRLSRAYSTMGQDRNTVEYAYPGDIVGVINPGTFSIGDTVSAESDFAFPPMPSFPPEVVASIRAVDVMRYKNFQKGMQQLCEEGTVQMLRSFENPADPPLVAAVGKLQFEVLQFRLKEEYNVETALDVLPYQYSAWVASGDPRTMVRPRTSKLALDKNDRVVILFSSDWEKGYTKNQNPQHSLVDFTG